MGIYDFEWRQYDPWNVTTTTGDPLAEKFYSYSPYTWTHNNPLKFIDPDGREVRSLEEAASGAVTFSGFAGDNGTGMFSGNTKGGSNSGDKNKKQTIHSDSEEPVVHNGVDGLKKEAERRLESDDPLSISGTLIFGKGIYTVSGKVLGVGLGLDMSDQQVDYFGIRDNNWVNGGEESTNLGLDIDFAGISYSRSDGNGEATYRIGLTEGNRSSHSFALVSFKLGWYYGVEGSIKINLPKDNADLRIRRMERMSNYYYNMSGHYPIK